MPHFPNLFVLYGPNTNGGLLVPPIHELGTAFALQCIERLINDDKRAIDVKEDAYWRYNDLIDAAGKNKASSDPRTSGYYWSEYGRSVTNCSIDADSMWRFL